MANSQLLLAGKSSGSGTLHCIGNAGQHDYSMPAKRPAVQWQRWSSHPALLRADAVVKDFIASPPALMPDLAPDADLLDSCPDGLSLAAESLAIPHSSSRNIIMFGTLQTHCTNTTGTAVVMVSNS